MKGRRLNPGVMAELRKKEILSPPINRIREDRAEFVDFTCVIVRELQILVQSTWVCEHHGVKEAWL